ncbi:hypothetical protein H4R35_001733 [Dimargaris xerosporica]|nr:hypothetical protein H4R35_001733 [Dimargaris xerosporica]
MVDVKTQQLLKQARPRNRNAAARADGIYTELCKSKQLNPHTGCLNDLIKGQCKSEKAAYRGIGKLLDLVARAVHQSVKALEPTDAVRQETRLLQSATSYDYKPADALNDSRPDITITARAVQTNSFPRPASKELWQNIAAVVEVKWEAKRASTSSKPSQTALEEACGQLGRYILNMYTRQPNRRFTWSVVTINRYVYVCLFGRDGVYRSQAISLATLSGRQQFVRFLVYWSLAGPVQFGLDPTIKFNAKRKHWAIACFDDTTIQGIPVQHVYYAGEGAYSVRPALFGRRTIAFWASEQPDCLPHVFIKDAWSVSTATGDDSRNEIALLRRVNQKLSMSDPGVLYPKLKIGGSVWQCGHGKWSHDDTTLAYGTIGAAPSLANAESSPAVYRMHRRMVVTPIAERLDKLHDFEELIVVLADAMAFHRTLYDDCNIFHRDISTSNIMMVRQNGQVQGILIDLDNAVHREYESTPGRPERTGTLPFMSISNLEGNENKRTAIDDWESLLYVICWIGTFGLGEHDTFDPKQHPTPVTDIDRWRKGSMADVARTKRMHMSSLVTFLNIPKCFQRRTGHEVLKYLAKKLYNALFQHPDCPGATIFESEDFAYHNVTANCGDTYDPLKDRSDYEHEIVSNCHEILRAAREELTQPKAKKPRTQ